MYANTPTLTIRFVYFVGMWQCGLKITITHNQNKSGMKQIMVT